MARCRRPADSKHFIGRRCFGRLEPDAAQAQCVDALDAFGRDATQQKSHSITGLRLASRRRITRAAPGRGIYLLGEVVRGKTMLMDLFFESLDFRRSGGCIFMSSCRKS